MVDFRSSEDISPCVKVNTRIRAHVKRDAVPMGLLAGDLACQVLPDAPLISPEFEVQILTCTKMELA